MLRRLARSLLARSLLALVATLAFGAAQSPTETTNVELILDASGSMFNRIDDGRYRIVAAKAVLADLIAGLPEQDGLNVGLRVYGAGMRAIEPGACEDTVLKVPVDGFARQGLLDTVKATQALGATPIALSLEQAAGDFPEASSQRDRKANESTVLITAPAEPGAYEIRYVTGQEYRTLARVPLTVR